MSGTGAETDGICILSLDNGGPGTYSQLLILKEQMSHLASDLKVTEDNVYPADYFDLMGGVGFGGLVVVMLGLLRMNIKEAIGSLLDITSRVFSEISWENLDKDINNKRLREAVVDMIKARYLLLDAKINEGPLDQRCKVVLYVANSTHIDHPQAFRTYSSRGSSLNTTIIDAVCATMSFPSYFQPVKIGPPRRQQSFVGGVVGANNPTRLLLKEAYNIYGEDRRVAQIMSIGCGITQLQVVDSRHEADMDKLLRETAGDCEVVANELSTWLSTVDVYLRLNVSMGMVSLKMKDWNTLAAIESQTTLHLAKSEVSEALGIALCHLRDRIGMATLGHLNHSSGIKMTAKKAPAVSPYFILREQPWTQMVNYLVTTASSQQKIFPITGMGGCGKTQLVSYFLRHYPNLYAQIIYVDASSSSSIKVDLQAWARTLGAGHDDDVWEDAIEALNSVPHGEQWILIFDNADDPGLDLTQFLPRDIHLTILITSRNRDIGEFSPQKHLELGEMTPEEALAALLQAAQRKLPLDDEELHSAHTLVEELGWLAIALVQAGTYCRQLSSTVDGVHQPYTFTQYLSLFRSHRADLLKKAEPSSLDNYQRGVYTTLDLSYNALSQECRGFLHLISFMHHTDIPLAAFGLAAHNAFKDPQDCLPREKSHDKTISEMKHLLCNDTEWNELHVQAIIQTLRSFSLVIASSMNGSLFLQLHPLIQAWSRDMGSVALEQYREMATQVLTACGDENIDLNRFIIPHVIDMLDQVGPHGLHVNDLAVFALILQQQGQYHKAGKLFEKTRHTMQQSAQSSPLKVILATSWLATSYWLDGKWAEAETLEVEVFEQRKKILGMEHPQTLLAAANLAATYRNQGRWDEAEKLEVEVLEHRRRVLGVEHPDTIAAAANLAMTYYSQDRWIESEKLEVEVLEQYRRIRGPDHLDTINATANLAGTYNCLGRLDESEKLKLEVLEQRRRILGARHPDTILAASSLATTYDFQERWAESEALEVEVLEQRRQILGPEHPDTILAAANLASTWHSQERWAEATKLGVEVVEQRKRILGMEHPDTIFASANLAATYIQQGLWDDAATVLLPAVQAGIKVLGQQHPSIQTDIEMLASAYENLGKNREAQEMNDLLTSCSHVQS